MTDQAEIKRLIEERGRAIGAKDARGALAYYADDVVNFDLAPPLAYRGRAATDPADLQTWFDSWDGPIGIGFDQLDVRVGGDLAFVFGFLHMTGRRTDGSETDVWTRMTLGLERRAGRWMIVHEHQSFPTMMDGSERSASHLRP